MACARCLSNEEAIDEAMKEIDNRRVERKTKRSYITGRNTFVVLHGKSVYGLFLIKLKVNPNL